MGNNPPRMTSPSLLISFRSPRADLENAYDVIYIDSNSAPLGKKIIGRMREAGHMVNA